jgi:hypothetical protein
MFKEWRVVVLFQMDPQSFFWEKVHDKFFDLKEEAVSFKSRFDKNRYCRTFLYHYV